MINVTAENARCYCGWKFSHANF